MITLKRVNTEVVKPIKYIKLDDDEKKPILGASLFPEIYANIFICAKKKTGKTTIINHIINKCTNSQTNIFVFASTFYKDKSFRTMESFCKKHKIALTAYTSLKDDDGNDILESIIERLKLEAKEIETKPEKVEKKKNPILLLDSDSDEDSDDEKPKKYKYRSPEYMFIFDDLSKELQSKSINVFLKMNRHFKSKVILSSQYIHDMRPEALKQIDYFLLLKGHPEKKLKLFHEHADINLDFSTFYRIYKNSTQDKFNFLYIDTNNCVYRKNFSSEYNVS